MPNNRHQAVGYANALKRRLQRKQDLPDKYTEFMTSLEDKGYSEKISSTETTQSERVWYIPHHSVHNPKKPDKVRVVFNCPAPYQGVIQY